MQEFELAPSQIARDGAVTRFTYDVPLPVALGTAEFPAQMPDGSAVRLEISTNGDYRFGLHVRNGDAQRSVIGIVSFRWVDEEGATVPQLFDPQYHSPLVSFNTGRMQPGQTVAQVKRGNYRRIDTLGGEPLIRHAARCRVGFKLH